MGIVASLFQGIFGSNAANNAASTQANAANNAANLERQNAVDALNFSKQQYGNSLNLLAPYDNTGVSANGRLAYLMGLNPGQGLPPGVINPNAPQNNGAPLDGSNVDSGALAQLRALRNGGNGGTRIGIPQNAAMLQPGQNPFQNNPPTGNPGTPPFVNSTPTANQFNMNPPITSGGQGMTQFQMNPPITSGGTTGGAAALNGGTGADTNPFPNGLGNLQNPTQNVNGAPGTVAQTGGNSFNMNPPITSPMFNPNDPNQGLSPDGSAPSGGAFGSLAQGWNQTFQSPTAVTEQNDPGYQFRLAQGNQALQNSAAARGGLLSGGTAKALTDYNQNAASNEYGNVYNRALQNYNTNYNTFTNDQTNLFNRLAALSGQGQVSANNLSNAGLGTAGNISNTLLTSGQQIGQNINNAGAATASGYINSANAINGAISNGTNSLNSLLALFGGA